MNLSPEWVPFLEAHGFEAAHWSTIGGYSAPDSEIMAWAREHRWVVFTHDLDFGIMLAHTRADGPSVVQARSQNVAPSHLGPLVVRAIKAHADLLAAGALLTVDEARARVRILPI